MRTSIRFTVAGDIKLRANVSGCLDRPGGMNIAQTLLYVIRALHIWELLISDTLADGKHRKAIWRPKQNRQKSVYAGLNFIWRKKDGDIIHGFVQAY